MDTHYSIIIKLIISWVCIIYMWNYFIFHINKFKNDN